MMYCEYVGGDVVEDLLHGRSSQGGDLLPDHGRARERDDAHLVVVGSSIWASLGDAEDCEDLSLWRMVSFFVTLVMVVHTR